MSKEEGYNGWANRETWLVNLYFMPSNPTEVQDIKEYVQELFASQENLFIRDMLDINKIDWYELEKSVT